MTSPVRPPLMVRCLVDGLRIREQPSSGKPIATLGLDELVTSLESDSETKRKIGTLGEWLSVRESHGGGGIRSRLVHGAAAERRAGTTGRAAGA
ncbi:MAG: hypothetical protein HND48_18515 [Chloroflexi bacterium]|nr:hypothetical protein [Chloroflexota bacterium]